MKNRTLTLRLDAPQAKLLDQYQRTTGIKTGSGALMYALQRASGFETERRALVDHLCTMQQNYLELVMLLQANGLASPETVAKVRQIDITDGF